MNRVPRAALLALVALLVVVLTAQVATAQPEDEAEAVDLLDRLLGRAASQPSDADVTTIVARGTSEVSVQPDTAVVTLGVESRGATAQEALDDNNQAMSDVVAALTDAGVADDDIQTGFFNLFQVEEPRPEPVDAAAADAPPPTSFRVSNTVTVESTDIDTVGDLIQTAVNAGANQVQGVRFTVSDPGRYRAQAVGQAVDAATADARAMAAAVGASLVRVVEMSTADTPIVFDSPAADLGRGAGGPVIRPGDVTVSASVDVTFAASGATVTDVAAEPEGQAEGSAEPTVMPPATEEDDTTPMAGTAAPTRGAGGTAEATEAGGAMPRATLRIAPTAASGGAGEPTGEAAAGGDTVEARPVVQAALARYRGSQPRVVLATSEESWNQDLGPLLPRNVQIDTDWDEEILAGVFLGERSTGGYMVTVRQVRLEDESLVFDVEVTEPGADDAVSTAVTSPFQIVRIPRSALPSGLDADELSAQMNQVGGR
jgi:uncharacterized protein YggE